MDCYNGNKDFIYAVIVCKDNESNFEYYEARAFLEKHYSLRIVLNVVICAIGEYESFIHQGYNKIIYSEKEQQVVYIAVNHLFLFLIIVHKKK